METIVHRVELPVCELHSSSREPMPDSVWLRNNQSNPAICLAAVEPKLLVTDQDFTNTDHCLSEVITEFSLIIHGEYHVGQELLNDVHTRSPHLAQLIG